MQSLSRDLEGAKAAIIAGAGHLPYEECPEEFSRIVLEFLSSAHAGSDQPMREVT
jgi:pimeloyl-ACP methyl ester carboxylesterase